MCFLESFPKDSDPETGQSLGSAGLMFLWVDATIFFWQGCAVGYTISLEVASEQTPACHFGGSRLASISFCTKPLRVHMDSVGPVGMVMSKNVPLFFLSSLRCCLTSDTQKVPEL